MNEKKYKKKYEFQKKLILKQSEQIEDLKKKNKLLEQECKEKDDLINSVSLLRNELIDNIAETKKYKEEYRKLVNETKKMIEIINQTVYKGRWRLVKFLIK